MRSLDASAWGEAILSIAVTHQRGVTLCHSGSEIPAELLQLGPFHIILVSEGTQPGLQEQPSEQKLL